LAYNLVQNPAAATLRRQVNIEKALAKNAEELFSYHIATIALTLAKDQANEFDSALIHGRLIAFKQVLQSGDIRTLLDVEQIIGLALGIRCLHITGVLKDEDAKVFKEIVKIIETRSWLNSVDLASYVAFSVSGIEKLSDEGKQAAAWLNNQLTDKFDQHQYPSYVSALFGLSYLPQQMTYVTPLDEVKLRTLLGSEQLSVKDLSKLSIALSNLSNAVSPQLAVDLGRKLEENVSQEFSSKVGADLQAGIKEAIALASSDISEPYANEIMKRVNRELSEFLEIKEGGVVSLHGLPASDIPSMDAEKHSLALIAISMSQREHLYLLDKENFHNAQQGVLLLQSGYRPISVRFTTPIKYVSTLLAFVAGITLPIVVTGSTLQDVVDAIKSVTAVSGSNPPLLALSKLPLPIFSIVAGVYFALALFRVMDYGFNHGSISSKALVQVLPIVNRIYKWFKGYKVDE